MKLRVALLEDNKLVLKDLKENLEKTGLVDVVAWGNTSEEFLSKVIVDRPEAVLLDIDLGGDSMNGIDIANKLRLPVLFVSGKTKEFIDGIEDLNINNQTAVEHITKPITIEKLNKILPKFINEIVTLNKKQFVYLDFEGSRRNKIPLDTVVCICAGKEDGTESNNKVIYFTDRKHEILIDFSFSKMEEKGFVKTQFITIHRSFRVSADKILKYESKTHEVKVEVFKSSGKSETKMLYVSETYRNKISRLKG